MTLGKQRAAMDWIGGRRAVAFQFKDGGQEVAVAMAVGIPIAPRDVVGKVCPGRHNKRLRLPADGSHGEMCQSQVAHQRHNAAARQLAFELSVRYRPEAVKREQAVDHHGAICGLKDPGAKRIGDVTVDLPSGRLHFDVRYASLHSSAVHKLADGVTAAEYAASDKLQSTRKLLGDAIDRVQFVPVGMDSCGAMSAAAADRITELAGAEAVRRIITDGLCEQANQIAKMLADARRGVQRFVADPDD